MKVKAEVKEYTEKQQEASETQLEACIEGLEEENLSLKDQNNILLGKLEKQTALITELQEQNGQLIRENKMSEYRISNLVEKAERQTRLYETKQEIQEQKIKILRMDLRHLRTTKARDTTLPRSVYTKPAPTTTPIEEETKKSDRAESLFSSKLPGFRVTPPQFQKLSTIDGSTDRKSYYLQFIHTAKRFELDEQQKLDNFLFCFRTKALKCFSTRHSSVQKNFDELMDTFDKIFGNKELPHSITRQLQESKQKPEETIEEFAERVQEMATDGYVGASEEIVEMMATEAFLKGCTDKHAALYAMDKEPNRIDVALQYLKSAIYNRKLLLGHKRPEIRRIQLTEEIGLKSDTEKRPESTIRVLSKDDTWRQKLESRVEQTEKDISGRRFTTSTERNRSRSLSPRSTVKKPPLCYNCESQDITALTVLIREDCLHLQPNS